MRSRSVHLPVTLAPGASISHLKDKDSIFSRFKRDGLKDVRVALKAHLKLVRLRP
jgi:hypothetical protein